LIFQIPDIGLKVVLEEAVLKNLLLEGRKHLPKEYGGILIGQYDPERTSAFIVKSLQPKVYQNTSYSFERGTTGLKDELIQLYNEKPSLFYLGEWHTHPNGSIVPSVTDENTLIKLSRSPQINIKNPLMMIIGLDEQKSSIGLYVHYNNKIYKYECE
jgi:[CysO sulfur-carrier protein]-S-L-cysteine hydrolase